jgi:hypothetical protein
VKTLYVFTFAPAGLGHLRVTKTLVESRPKNCDFVVLGSKDSFVTSVHRFTSINPIAREIFERSQRGVLESLFTTAYVSWLRAHTESVYRDLMRELRHTDATNVVVLASHFGMAHQIAEIKERVQRESGKEIKLVVQVTDDTYQKAWAVRGADLIVVPSKMRSEQYQAYMKSKSWQAKFAVCPYPLSLRLMKNLSKETRDTALSKGSKKKVKVMVPVSGAAVGLEYYTKLIDYLTGMSNRFEIYVVSKRARFTSAFIKEMKKNKYVQVWRGKNDKETVDMYEDLYAKNTIHLEITKPSEQSFKAMLGTNMIGGSLLLLTEPVGRQEEENKDFLVRHNLMCQMSASEIVERCHTKNCGGKCPPRVIDLPKKPAEAGELIVRLLEDGCLARMVAGCEHRGLRGDVNITELGVRCFWNEVEKLTREEP